MKAIFMSIPLLAAQCISGCTAEQAYGTAQAYQRNQCTKLPDKAEYARCMSRTDTPYDSYKREREPEKQ